MVSHKKKKNSGAMIGAIVGTTLVVAAVIGAIVMNLMPTAPEIAAPDQVPPETAQEESETPQPPRLQVTPFQEVAPAVRNSNGNMNLANASIAGPSNPSPHDVTQSDPPVEMLAGRHNISATPVDDFKFTTWEALNDYIQPSVVRIDVELTVGTTQGSGFVLDSTGVVATSYHVVAGANRINVTFRNGDEFVVSGYLHLDINKDIALLKIDPSSGSQPLKSLSLLRGQPKTGAEVAAFGAPHGFDFSFTPGSVSAIRSAQELQMPDSGVRAGNWVQHTAAISEGSSGGPLVNRSANVVAMNTLFVTEAQSLNSGISSSDLFAALNRRSSLVNVSPESAPAPRTSVGQEGDLWGFPGDMIVDDVGTASGRERLGRMSSLTVDVLETEGDPQNVLKATVLAAARNQLRGLGVNIRSDSVSDSGDNRLRVFMALDSHHSRRTLSLSAMIFTPDGSRTFRRVWEQPPVKIGNVRERKLEKGELPADFSKKIEEFFRKVRNSIRHVKRSNRPS